MYLAIYPANRIIYFRILTGISNLLMDGQSKALLWIILNMSDSLMLNQGDKVKCLSWDVIQYKCQYMK